MSYTLRQVLPMLTKPELALFEASRAGAVKELTVRQLVSKIERARALRDKYRDTYRRQTVRTRTGQALRGAPSAGGENSRTEVKAVVMDEVLQRLQAQHQKLQDRQSKADARAAREPTARATKAPSTSPSRRRSANAQPGPGADVPMRGAAGKVPRQSGRNQKMAANAAYASLAGSGGEFNRSGGGAGVPARKPAAKAAAPAKRKPGARKQDSNAITGATEPAAKLMRQVRGALKKQQAEDPIEGVPTPRRGSRTKVGGSASDNAQGAVPTNMPARAQRVNPIKAEPINKTIRASARSRQRVATAKRDAR